MGDITSKVLFSKTGLGQPATRVSVAADGLPANARVVAPAVSADGRFISMTSTADNLAPGDDNRTDDVLLLDRENGRFEMLSRSTHDNPSYQPSISADGKVVAFQSWSTLTGPEPTSREQNVYVRDLVSGKTENVSAGLHGRSEAAQIAANGKVVVFAAIPDGKMRTSIYVHDRSTGHTAPILGEGGAEANSNCWNPATSADGRYVVFTSTASNLAPAPPDTGTLKLAGMGHIFMHDRMSGTTRRLDVGEANESHNPSVSADGRFVAYGTRRPLDQFYPARIYVHDLQSGNKIEVPHEMDGQRLGPPGSPTLSADGRFLSFVANGSDGDRAPLNVYVFDCLSQKIGLVSITADGQTPDAHCHAPRISADGTTIAYSTEAINMVGMAVHGEQVYVSPNPLHPQTQERAMEAAEAREREAGSVEKHDDFVIINGVKVPRRG